VIHPIGFSLFSSNIAEFKLNTLAPIFSIFFIISFFAVNVIEKRTIIQETNIEIKYESKKILNLEKDNSLKIDFITSNIFYSAKGRISSPLI
jgi:hypothetical protein